MKESVSTVIEYNNTILIGLKFACGFTSTFCYKNIWHKLLSGFWQLKSHKSPLLLNWNLISTQYIMCRLYNERFMWVEGKK